MTKMKVIRDAAGKIINIGPWDSGEQEEETNLLNPNGKPIKRLVQTNPLPQGAYEDEADIVKGWDGGLYEAGDPKAVRA